MAIERLWGKISPRPFITDGSDGGIITVNTVCDFRVKQIVKITALSELPVLLQVKKVISTTKLIVGPNDKNILSRTDLSKYTLAKVPYIEAAEQNKTGIPEKDQLHMTLEREPVNARRVFPVDCFGNGYNSDNPLPVDAIVSVTDSSKPNREGIEVLNISDNSTIKEFTFPDNTKYYRVRVRKCETPLFVGLSIADMNNNIYETVYLGNDYSPEVLNEFPNSYKLYFKIKRGVNIKLEVHYWYRV